MLYSVNFRARQPLFFFFCLFFCAADRQNRRITISPKRQPKRAWITEFRFRQPKTAWITEFRFGQPKRAWITEFWFRQPKTAWITEFRAWQPKTAWITKFRFRQPKKKKERKLFLLGNRKKKQDIILLNQVSFVAIMTRRNAPGYIILNRRRFPVLTRLKCIEQPLPL